MRKPQPGARAAAAALLACIAAGAGVPPARANPEVLADLSPRQRVAQLFLVAVFAPEASGLDDALSLVGEQAIGGVVLQAGNNLFGNVAGEPLAREIAALTGVLQEEALANGAGIPLFVAIDHEGDGPRRTHLREGFTTLPSPMAIGATWSPDDAGTIGRIAGAELAAVGVNVLLGPVVDVLTDPRVDSGGDIGTRAFGGDPFWVGKLGSAYVAGLHEGGAGRVLAVAKHFPGHGGSDRLPDVEVATIHKGLEALRGAELPPFEAVTDGAPGNPDAPHVADALMTSHIRYQGLQGGIRHLTPPISFDREGLQTLLGLEGTPFGAWRDSGGLIVSDSLGVPAVRLWFTQSGGAEPDGRFPSREIVRRALLAGHDVLTIAQFAPQPAWSLQMANVVDAIDYLTAEYHRDHAIRERVDAAAARILEQKARLYPDWALDAVRVDAAAAGAAVGRREAVEAAAAVAHRAVTVWAQQGHPERGDRLVVVTPGGAGAALTCPNETCGLELERWRRLADLGPTWVEGFLLERYGPDGTGAIRPEDVSSLTFCQLERSLSAAVPPTASPPPPVPDATALPENAPEESDAAPPDPCDPPNGAEAVRQALAAADWVVFAFGELGGDAVRLLGGFLLPQTARIVKGSGRMAVLSFGPPYYVDSTNLARLDAHISAYSKVPASIEAAISMLFGDAEASGRAPVTVEDAGYVLSERLEPDASLPLPPITAGPLAARNLPARLDLTIGPILDRNGNLVPDDTSIELQVDPPDALDDAATRRLATRDGLAHGTLVFSRGGRVAISAFTASGARSAAPLVADLPVPSAVPSPSPTMVAAAGGDVAAPEKRGAAPGIVALAWALAGAVAAAVVATATARRGAMEGAPHEGLVAACGALALYCAFALWRRATDAPALLPWASDPVGATVLGGALATAAARAIKARASATRQERS